MYINNIIHKCIFTAIPTKHTKSKHAKNTIGMLEYLVISHCCTMEKIGGLTFVIFTTSDSFPLFTPKRLPRVSDELFSQYC